MDSNLSGHMACKCVRSAMPEPGSCGVEREVYGNILILHKVPYARRGLQGLNIAAQLATGTCARRGGR